MALVGRVWISRWLTMRKKGQVARVGGIKSYDVNPVRPALKNVTTEREDIAPKREAMFQNMEDLMEAAKMRAVTTALSSVWNDLIAMQRGSMIGSRTLPKACGIGVPKWPSR